MRDNVTRPAFETITLDLFDAARKRAQDRNDWAYETAILLISGVFEGRFHARSFRFDTIMAIAAAQSGFELNEPVRFQSYLTRLCREKVLRSRMANGARYYEVNY